MPRAALAALCLGAAAPAGVAATPTHQSVAPGGPGAVAYWSLGRKDGVGSAYGATSTVWYTLAGGTLTEVFYPTTDTPDVTSLSFIVTDGRTFADQEAVDAACLTTHPDPRSEQYAITCQGRRHPYQLTATYLSDPLRPTVLIHIRLAAPAHAAPLSLYVRYDAALNGNGTNDSGQVAGSALLAHDDQGHYGPVASALIANPALAGATTGYAGAGDDAAVSFRTRFTAGPRYMQAGPGNIVQGAYVPLRANGEADLALGFGGAETAALSTARASLSQPFARTAAAFIAGWHGYAARLTQPDSRFSLAQRDQYFAAALALKASEDKRYPGALVASLSTPWGPSVPANQNSGQGYHRVWARDLYEMATGFIADGDRATARDIIHYMLNTLEGPDGSVPQNSLVDGTPVDSGIQMDEIALPADPGLEPWRGRPGELHDPPPLLRRLFGPARTDHQPGTLGRRRWLFAVHHRGRDRRIGLRGGNRRQERRCFARPDLPGGRRRVAAKREKLDGHRHRTARPPSLLHPPGRQPRPE